MSATPEQIADLCDRLRSHAANAQVISRQSIDMDAAAALIRAQDERVRVLEETTAYMYTALCGARHAIDLLMGDTDPNEDTPATLAMQAIQKAIERADLLTATGAA